MSRRFKGFTIVLMLALFTVVATVVIMPFFLPSISPTLATPPSISPDDRFSDRVATDLARRKEAERRWCADASRFDIAGARREFASWIKSSNILRERLRQPDTDWVSSRDQVRFLQSQTMTEWAAYAWLIDSLSLEYLNREPQSADAFYGTFLLYVRENPTEKLEQITYPVLAIRGSLYISPLPAQNLDAFLAKTTYTQDDERFDCLMTFLHAPENAALLYDIVRATWESQFYFASYDFTFGTGRAGEAYRRYLSAIGKGLPEQIWPTAQSQIDRRVGGFADLYKRYELAQKLQPDSTWLSFLSTTDIWPSRAWGERGLSPEVLNTELAKP